MRAVRLLIPAACILSLGACEPTDTVDVSRGAPAVGETAPAALVLGGVNLEDAVSLLGTEPFWSVQLTQAGIVYEGLDRPEQTAPRADPVMAGTTATWDTTTDAGNPLVVTLIETPCSDGMSDRTYPLTARVEIGEETLNGCAASTAAIRTSGESGPVG